MTNLEYRDFNPYTDRDPADFMQPAPTRIQRMQAFAARLPLVSLAVPTYPIVIDLNHWVTVDLTKAKEQSNVAGVIIKLTEGVNFLDPKADMYIRWAWDLKMPLGVFHFFRRNLSGDDQAKWFLDNVEQYRSLTGGHMIYDHLDCETADGVDNGTGTYRTYKCATKIQAAFKIPGIYLNLNGLNTLFHVNLQLVEWFNQFKTWWAQWTSALQPTIPAKIVASQVGFWQNGISGSHSWIPVIQGATVVDHGFHIGTHQGLIDLAGIGGEEPPPPSDLAQRVAALETAYAAQQSRLDAITTVANGAAGQAATNKASIEALAKSLSATNQNISALSTDMNAAFGRIAKVEQANVGQDNALAGLAGRVAAIEAKLAAVKEKL